MTYNTRFKDKLQREQKHRHRLGNIDVKNIDHRKQTSMFSMFRHRCPITTYRSFVVQHSEGQFSSGCLVKLSRRNL